MHSCVSASARTRTPGRCQFRRACRRLLKPTEIILERRQQTRMAHRVFFKGAGLARWASTQKRFHVTKPVSDSIQKMRRLGSTWGHSIGFLGRHQDVVKCCDRALEINPNFPPLWILKGLAFFPWSIPGREWIASTGGEDGDASAAGHMARCRMAHAEWYFRLGSQYQQEGNNGRGNQLLREGSRPQPVGNAIIWSNKGAALLALKRGQEAVVCLTGHCTRSTRCQRME